MLTASPALAEGRARSAVVSQKLTVSDSRFYYDERALVRALDEVGIRAGDTVFSHVGVGMLGYPKGDDRSEQAAWRVMKNAFLRAIGKRGTWVVPTYSYTYTQPGQIYDPGATPSAVGRFTEYFRCLPGARRSLDPIHSVAAIGARAQELVDDLPRDSFGAGCVYDRLRQVHAKLCNVGVGFRYATYVHHIEQTVEVPYRYPKYFTGVTRVGGRERQETWLYYVRALEDPAGLPDLRRLEQEMRARRAVQVARVGIGEITCVELPPLHAAASECIRRDPWFMARGGAAGYAGDRIDQTGRVEFCISLPRALSQADR